MTMRSAVATLCFALAAASVQAQNIPAARMSVLLAEARKAPDARDLLTLRNGIRNGDSETARIAVRALGRLGRPALVRDITPALRFSLPELRAEAATAIASAVNGTATAAVKSANVTLAVTTLSARLEIENEPVVRAAILEALATIPLVDVGQLNQVEAALARFGRSEFIAERLSVARGFEALVRLNRSRWTPSAATIELLRELAGISVPVDGAAAVESAQLLQRDVRVRRLAVEALTEAAAIDETLLRQASVDSDPQVRRLALRAVPTLGFDDAAAAAALRSGLADTQSMVRIEALRIGAARSGAGCQDFIASATDPSLPVALTAIDLLAQCTEPGGIDVLSEIAEALPDSDSSRTWNRAAHALTALSRVAPERAKRALPRFADARLWQLRLVAVNVASALGDTDTVERLSRDANSWVADAASRTSAGVAFKAAPVDAMSSPALEAADLRRLMTARARITIRGVGTLEIALLTFEAPATVVWFARTAESGRFNHLPLGRVLPNVVALTPASDAGSPVNDDESGAWPHVRGTMGFLAGSSGAQGSIFIDLVDNPRFDRVHPVFAQILNGTELLDQLVEGDMIEAVEIVAGT